MKRQVESTVNGESWTLIIKPKKHWFELNLREIIRYRDLVFLFVRRDFSTVYKQTILGPLWFIIQPLITTVMYSFVFGKLANIGTDGVPELLFYFGGTMLWTYFESCFRNASDTFTSNAGLFGKVYFPRLTAPLSKVFSNMITLGIQFTTLVVFLIYFIITGSPVKPGLGVLLFPPIIAWIAALATGMGMIVSSMTTKYRDLRQLLGFGLTLWMYATPVVYPLSKMPENFKWIAWINPMSAPVEVFRTIFYGVGSVDGVFVSISIGVTLLMLVLGLMLFNRNEQTFVDIV